MIGYLDASAFIPLLIAEPASDACARFWDDCDSVVSTRLPYVEAAAALAQAHRLGRLSIPQHRAARHTMAVLWAEVEVVEIDQPLIDTAADLADDHALRGYDAVHCAAATLLHDDDLVSASGDQRLLDAWRALGLSTFDTNAS